MITLNWSSSFKRAFKRTIKKDPLYKDKIINSMLLLQQDPFNPTLKTHKLKGILEGSWSCSVDYELRIIFDLITNPEINETEILLIDIGTHDEVY